MNTPLSSKRGSLAAGLLVLVAFTAASLLVIKALATNSFLLGSLQIDRKAQWITEAWEASIAADALAEIQNGTIHQSDAAAVARRTQRLLDLVTPPSGTDFANGLAASAVTIGEWSTTPFSKTNVLVASGTQGLLHPLGRQPSARWQQNFTAVLKPDAFSEGIAWAGALTLSEVAASDVGVILTSPYSATSGTKITVASGVCWFTRGFTAQAGATQIQAEVVVGSNGALSTGEAGKNVSGSKVAISGLYQPSWATAVEQLVEPRNLGLPGSQNGFFDSATTLVIVAAGVPSGLVPGVTYGEYPSGSGVKRVIVDVTTAAAARLKLFVTCVGTADRSAGIVVIGAPSSVSGNYASIATNGSVWLQGNNVQPVLIASGGGVVTLADGGAAVPLNQAWAGVLFFPVPTTYQVPQSASGGQLSVNGSITTGTLSGNLTTMSVFETRPNDLRNLSPRAAFVYSVGK